MAVGGQDGSGTQSLLLDDPGDAVGHARTGIDDHAVLLPRIAPTGRYHAAVGPEHGRDDDMNLRCGTHRDTVLRTPPPRGPRRRCNVG
ncbi:hypothetical protein GCM10027059_21880 [Myceligenerans halotolerans]